MQKILIYTFRTNKFINEIKELFSEVIILGKINLDLKKLYSKIKSNKYDYIIGIADSNSNNSFFEPIAINKFNNFKVIKMGQDKFDLFVPELNKTNFKISNKPTKSFCNLTMYKITYFIKENKVKTKLSFVHINKNDLNQLKNIFT